MSSHGLKPSVRNNLLNDNERYINMVEEVADYAILLLDPNGIIRNWNQGAEKIKGYTAQEVIGKSFKIFYPEEDQARHLPEALIAEATKNGRAIHEGWRVRKDGTYFWGSVVITALHDQEQYIIGFTKVTRDLTEKKNAEESLKQQASDLAEQNKELQQFAYIASHDMKEPLRKIILYTSLLKEKITDVIGEKERDHLDRVIHSAEKMQHLINDLLAYSRTSLHDDIYSDVELNDIVSEVIDSHCDGLEALGGKISLGTFPVIRGISFQLRQLFDNLVNNAIKYRSYKRRLHVRITADKVKSVEGGLPNPNGYYRILIADNGIGFDMEFSKKIFDLFQRLDNADDAGTGIGLAICQKIMQNHKGYIHANSLQDKGTTFGLYFPA